MLDKRTDRPIQMICRIATDFGDVWSRAAHERLTRCGDAHRDAVESTIISIATRWAFRSWCREHPLDDLIMFIEPQQTPLLSVLDRWRVA